MMKSLLCASIRATKASSVQRWCTPQIRRALSDIQVAVKCVLNRIRRRCNQNAQLVGQSRHQSARGRSGQFIQMNRNHAPGPLHTRLHQEGSKDNHRQTAAKGPKRYHTQRKQQSSQHSFSSPGHLRELTKNHRADNGTDIRTITMFARIASETLCTSFKKSGYKSCVPCDKNIINVISTTR